MLDCQTLGALPWLNNVCIWLEKRPLVSNVWLDGEGAVAGLRVYIRNDLALPMGPIDVARSLHVTLSRDSCVRGAVIAEHSAGC